MRIQEIRQFFWVISDDFDFELRHRGLHDLVDDSINHFVGIGIEQIFQEMQIICVFAVGLISVIHLGDSWVKHVLKKALFVHFIDIEGQAFG